MPLVHLQERIAFDSDLGPAVLTNYGALLGAILALAVTCGILTGCSTVGESATFPVDGKWILVEGAGRSGPGIEDIVLSLEESRGSIEGDATITFKSGGDLNAVVFGSRGGPSVDLTLELGNGEVWDFDGDLRSDPARIRGTLTRSEGQEVELVFGRIAT